MTASVCPAMDDSRLTKDDLAAQKREASRGMDQGIRVLSYLIGGVLVYGLLGWLGDHFFGTSFLLPMGIVLGAALGVYVIIRRFGDVSGPTDKKVSTTSKGDR